jgi:hypothetical protein
VNFILLQPELAKIKINHNLDQSMWHVHDIIKTNKEKLTREYSFGTREYPCIRITCQVFRQPGYFNWNVIFPILLITFASLCSFVLDHKLPQSRLPSTATMLLSSVSYKANISRLLPTQVGYLTSLDLYSLGSILIITLILLYHACFAGVISFFLISESIAYTTDKFMFFTFLLTVLIKQYLYATWMRRVNNKRLKLINDSMFHNNYKNKNV